jgi:hypothetical protein
MNSRRMKWSQHALQRREEQIFWCHLENSDVDEGILKWILKKWDGVGVKWVQLAQNIEQFRVFVKEVMNIQTP